jgi:hypothetical protein
MTMGKSHGRISVKIVQNSSKWLADGLYVLDMFLNTS